MKVNGADQSNKTGKGVCGVVQGVGFRPFVYRLAQDHNLKGWVRNTLGSVEIEIEGKAIALSQIPEVIIVTLLARN